MEILRKQLRPAEVNRRCVCIPKQKWHLFPKVGQSLVILDSEAGCVYEVVVGSQYRLGMASWYREHDEVRPGDEIVFWKENGNMRVDVSRPKRHVREVSLPHLLGREIEGKKIIDIKHVAGKGTILVVEETREMSVDEILNQLDVEEQ